MKSIIALLAVIMSASAFSMETTGNTSLAMMNLPKPLAITSSPVFLTGFSTFASQFKAEDAMVVLNDSQEYMQSGKMSLILAGHIQKLQDATNVSEGEALDLIMALSEEVLLQN